MAWEVRYTPDAADDLAKLDASVRPEIMKGIRKVSQNPGYPDGYGKPLAGALSGLYKIKFLRSGIRVVYALRKIQQQMVIVIISARADNAVYQEAVRRNEKHAGD